MFTENPNLIKYDEKVMIYKGFVSKENVDLINSKMNNILQKGMSDSESRIPWYRDKTSPIIPELFKIWEDISEFLLPTHVIHPRLVLSIMRPGEEMFVHEDSPGEGKEHLLTNDDVWSTCTALDYGVIAYFGEYEGGEVFYPELDIEISPEPGDLVIHGATPRWKHGVKPVKSGMRYAFSNFSLPYEKNPGSFYNYKTKEYSDMVNGKISTWINPLFENKRDYVSLEDYDKVINQSN
jgi:hypothetical protein